MSIDLKFSVDVSLFYQYRLPYIFNFCMRSFGHCINLRCPASFMGNSSLDTSPITIPSSHLRHQNVANACSSLHQWRHDNTLFYREMNHASYFVVLCGISRRLLTMHILTTIVIINMSIDLPIWVRRTCVHQGSKHDHPIRLREGNLAWLLRVDRKDYQK